MEISAQRLESKNMTNDTGTVLIEIGLILIVAGWAYNQLS
jgi:hypothetical protein